MAHNCWIQSCFNFLDWLKMFVRNEKPFLSVLHHFPFLIFMVPNCLLCVWFSCCFLRAPQWSDSFLFFTFISKFNSLYVFYSFKLIFSPYVAYVFIILCHFAGVSHLHKWWYILHGWRCHPRWRISPPPRFGGWEMKKEEDIGLPLGISNSIKP